MALAAPVAQAATPAPGYGQFAGCPSQEENPSVEVCLYSLIKSGHFQMGSKDVPISNPISLSGGTNGSLENFVANSKGGLAKVKQPVPGGVIGLTGLDWLVNFLSVDALKLYAVTELVGPPVIGQAISLPIKVHLINPVLGNKCYIGSATNPISLNLIEGTTSPPPPNQPITGKSPEFAVDEEKGLIQLLNGVYVDNSFAAPAAKGCVLTLLGFIPVSIDGLVNSQSGLPSPAGTNETVQNMDMEIADALKVYP
jgi:hypothetical protein